MKESLEEVFRTKLDESSFFTLDNSSLCLRADAEALKKAYVGVSEGVPSLAWSANATRMALLLMHSLRFEEPVLLIGETGCGKVST